MCRFYCNLIEVTTCVGFTVNLIEVTTCVGFTVT